MELWQTYPSYIKSRGPSITFSLVCDSLLFPVGVNTKWSERQLDSLFCITLLFYILSGQLMLPHLGMASNMFRLPLIIWGSCIFCMFLLFIFLKTTNFVPPTHISVRKPWLLELIHCACKFQSGPGAPLTFAGFWALITGSKSQQIPCDPIPIKSAWDCSSYPGWRQRLNTEGELSSCILGIALYFYVWFLGNILLYFTFPMTDIHIN